MSSSFTAAGPVTLSEAQIMELHQKLREMRHDLNGKLTIVSGYAELIAGHPEKAAKYASVILAQMEAIKSLTQNFSQTFEATFRLGR